MLTFIAVWFIVSIPAGIFIGNFIAVGQARQYE
jgi:uncharacterized protein YneF (UPF0154 family)